MFDLGVNIVTRSYQKDQSYFKANTASGQGRLSHFPSWLLYLSCALGQNWARLSVLLVWMEPATDVIAVPLPEGLAD